MRCLTVSCNPAIDTTYLLDRFEPGEINRVVRKVAGPGGKGNNVARVLTILGHQSVATGFTGGHAGRFIEESLGELGIEPAFVPVAGELRVCLTIVETETGIISEIREPGLAVTDQDADDLLDLVCRLATGVEVVVVSGSLAPGLSPEFYARLLGALRGLGACVAFDSSGDGLRRGLAGQPDLVKPNTAELEGLLGRAGSVTELIAFACQELIGSVLAAEATVLLSLGAAGAILIRAERAWQAMAPAVDAVNTVGCGDALLAGYLDARSRAAGDREALAQAVAVGTAAALQEAIGVVSPADVERLRRTVRVSEVGDGDAASLDW